LKKEIGARTGRVKKNLKWLKGSGRNCQDGRKGANGWEIEKRRKRRMNINS